MNSPRFYCPFPLAVGQRIVLPEGAARHACRVLRLRLGDPLTLFDGHGGEYAGQLAEVGRDRATVDVLRYTDVTRASPLAVTLVQALQSAEKMDFTIQKAVELGVERIVPVASRRSVLRLEGERAARRVAHWTQVVISACEQSGRNCVPDVTSIEVLEKWLDPAAGRATDRLRLMFSPEGDMTIDQLPTPVPGMRVEILIGAEGGLAPEEIELAKQAGFMLVRLGPRVLRTETAGLAALAVLQCLWGDLGKGDNHV